MFKFADDYLILHNMSQSLKINNIDLSTLSDDQLKKLCVKYEIVPMSELVSIQREKMLIEIRSYLLYKITNYKQRKRSLSDPNIKPIETNQPTRRNSVHNIIPTISKLDDSQPSRERRMSQPNNIHSVKSSNGPPTSMENYNRDRRMSHPITPNEVDRAKENHQIRQSILEGQKMVQQTIDAPTMQKYDEMGMYPAVKRLVAIGDVHGDLKVTLQALRLAKVIPRDIFPNNVDR